MGDQMEIWRPGQGGWMGSPSNGWFRSEPAKPKLDPKILSQMESKLIKLEANFTGDPWTYDTHGKEKIYFTQGDGMWVMVDKPFARILVQVNDTHYPGEPVGLVPGYKLKIPKLPYKLFGQILSFFRHYVIDLDYKGVTEAMTQVYYDMRNNEYFIEIPKQEVSGAGVKYLFEDQNPRCKEKGVYKVFDIHSHNTMSSFFSGVDDRDEKGWQFFGVIGEIGTSGNKDNYSTKFRAGIDGYYFNTSYADMVDPVDDTIDISFPAEWCDRVTMWAATVFNPVIVEHTPFDNNYDYDDTWPPYGYDWYKENDRYRIPTRERKVLFPKTHTVQGSSHKVEKKLNRISELAERLMANFEGLSPTEVQIWLDNNPHEFEILMDLQKTIDHMAIGSGNEPPLGF